MSTTQMVERTLGRLHLVERRLASTLHQIQLGCDEPSMQRQMWKELRAAERQVGKLERALLHT